MRTRKRCPKCHGKGIDTRLFPDAKHGTMIKMVRDGRWINSSGLSALFGEYHISKRQAKWVCICCDHEEF